ncbi:helix-turn-helix domain-containing protein [Enterococcus sp. LJL128]|uniref:helix-turn-helix domain-containing protein n=1 Tax=Enterococcus sp. LJL51 TaxID=3416656 RepID=UPI003CEAF738
MDIGKIIKEKRTEKNLTQEDLAQKFFVTRQLISKWENGRSYPDLEQVVKLSELFELSLDELLREDHEMVKELKFDTKKKKWFKFLIILPIVLIIGIITFLGLIWWIDIVLLDYDDIEITKIEKEILPEKEVVIERTGETVTLPEDVEYTIYFKTNRFLVNLVNISGEVRRYDDNNIMVDIIGEHHLYSWNKESKIWIQSEREKNVFDPNLNLGKSIYLYNFNKASSIDIDDLVNGENAVPSIEDLADKLIDLTELEKLPNKQKKED